MILQLERVVFDHTQGAADERALKLWDHTASTRVPGWTASAAQPSIAAYALKSNRRRKLTIEATIFFPAAPVPGVTVRAQSLVSDNVLGEAQATLLPAPDKSGRSVVTLPLANVELWARGIGKYSQVWQWQFQLPNASAWIDLGVTHHVVYTTLDLPTQPWSQDDAVGGNPLWPRPEVLEWACAWAAGIRFKTTAARTVLRSLEAALFGLGDRANAPLTYLETDDSRYTRAPAVAFALTDFLSLLAGNPPGGDAHVDCSDCASALATFANALGCGLRQRRVFHENDRTLSTNQIVTIGAPKRKAKGGNRTVKVARSRRFRFHEFTILQPDGADAARTYDGCLMIDRDSDPTSAGRTHKFGLAKGLGSGELPPQTRSLKYLMRLIAPTSRPSGREEDVAFRLLDGIGTPAAVDVVTAHGQQTYAAEIARLLPAPERQIDVPLRLDPLPIPGFQAYDRVVNPMAFQTDTLFKASVEFFYVAVAEGKRRAPDKRLRLTIAYSRLIEEAREALSWLLAESPARLSRVRTTEIGDIAFKAPGQSTLYFVRGPIFARIANIGQVRARLTQAAREVDAAISAMLLTPPQPGRARNRAEPASVVRTTV